MAVLNGSTHTPDIDVSIATSPNDLASVPGILKQIDAQGTNLSAEDYEGRLKLLAHARALVQALETPRETMIKHAWAQPSVHVAITTLYDAGLFQLMAKFDRPMTVSECAESIKMDPKLLTRLMRHLGSMGYLKETAVDEYASTNFSKALSLPIITDGYLLFVNGLSGAFSHFSRFSKDHNHQMVVNHDDTALQYAEKTDLPYFAWLQSRGLGSYFNNHMAGYRQGRPSWMDPDTYPVEERLCKGADTSADAPFLVDIGGNRGHDLAEFLTKHPSHPGKLILEDLPVVLGEIQELDSRIERVAYDFRTEQPHKGARAYYMHSVLHDWPDDVCADILKNIVAAMKPGYSRLLINENVIPDRGADWQATALDVLMLTLFASSERTLTDWTRLLEPAGLRIMKIWGGGNGTESLIECELASH